MCLFVFPWFSISYLCACILPVCLQTFHSTQYMRHVSRPDYTPEPDVVHEVRKGQHAMHMEASLKCWAGVQLYLLSSAYLLLAWLPAADWARPDAGGPGIC